MGVLDYGIFSNRITLVDDEEGDEGVDEDDEVDEFVEAAGDVDGEEVGAASNVGTGRVDTDGVFYEGGIGVVGCCTGFTGWVTGWIGLTGITGAIVLLGIVLLLLLLVILLLSINDIFWNLGIPRIVLVLVLVLVCVLVLIWVLFWTWFWFWLTLLVLVLLFFVFETVLKLELTDWVFGVLAKEVGVGATGEVDGEGNVNFIVVILGFIEVVADDDVGIVGVGVVFLEGWVTGDWVKVGNCGGVDVSVVTSNDGIYIETDCCGFDIVYFVLL